MILRKCTLRLCVDLFSVQQLIHMKPVGTLESQLLVSKYQKRSSTKQERYCTSPAIVAISSSGKQIFAVSPVARQSGVTHLQCAKVASIFSPS